MTRQAAFELLRSNSDAPLRDVDRLGARYGFDDRDRGLIRAIVGSEVRHRGSLRAIVKAFVPRYRYDQLMRLGWKVFLPISLAFVAIVAGVLVTFNLAP